MIVFKIKDLNNSVNPCQNKSLGYQTLQKKCLKLAKRKGKKVPLYQN